MGAAILYDKIIPIDASILIPLILIVLALFLGLRSKKAMVDFFVLGVGVCLMSTFAASFNTMLIELSRMVAGSLSITSEYLDASPSVLNQASGIMGTVNMSLWVFIVSNIVLLLIGVVRTISLDFWNIWLCTFASGMAQFITGNSVYGIIVLVTFSVITIVLSDMTRDAVSGALDTKGMGVSNIASLSISPVGALVNFIYKKLPKKFQRDVYIPNLLKRKYAVPIIVFIYVAAVAYLCSFGFMQSVKLGVNMAALVFMLPIIMKYIINSLMSILSIIKKISMEKLGMTTPLSIALPDYCFFGNDIVLLISIVTAPIILLITKFTGALYYIPISSMSLLPSVVLVIVALCGYGLVRVVVTFILSYTAILFTSSAMAGVLSRLLQESALVDMSRGGYSGFSGVNPFSYITSQLSSWGVAGMAILITATLVLMMWNYNRLTGYVKKYVRKAPAIRSSMISKTNENTDDNA